MQFKCPVCRKLCRAYVDANVSFNCSSCGTKIKPHENGKVDIVTESTNEQTIELQNAPTYTAPKPAHAASKPEPQRANPQATNRPTVNAEIKRKTTQTTPGSKIGFPDSVWPFIIGLLLVFGYYGWRDFLKPRMASKPIVDTYQPVKYPKQPPTQSYQTAPSSTSQTPEQPSANVANSDSGIVYLHTVNTFRGTDKTDKCKGVLDESSNTLNLTSIDNPISTFKLIYKEGGACIFQYYANGVLEAEKTVQRRSDLENGNGTLIYTSRTGEITISLSY